MKHTVRLPFWIYLVAALVLPAAGFGLAGLWPGVVLPFAGLALGWAGRRAAWTWMPDVLLALDAGLCAVGALLGAPAYLMVAGAAAGLACWELSGQPEPGEHPLAQRYTQEHLKLLALSVGVGLLLAEAGLLLRFSLSFGVLFGAALVVMFSLYRLAVLLRGRSS